MKRDVISALYPLPDVPVTDERGRDFIGTEVKRDASGKPMSITLLFSLVPSNGAGT